MPIQFAIDIQTHKDKAWLQFQLTPFYDGKIFAARLRMLVINDDGDNLKSEHKFPSQTVTSQELTGALAAMSKQLNEETERLLENKEFTKKALNDYQRKIRALETEIDTLKYTVRKAEDKSGVTELRNEYESRWAKWNEHCKAFFYNMFRADFKPDARVQLPPKPPDRKLEHDRFKLIELE
jgi:hypothetical protein